MKGINTVMNTEKTSENNLIQSPANIEIHFYQSPTISKVTAALFKYHEEMAGRELKRNKTATVVNKKYNTQYTYEYADLNSVINHTEVTLLNAELLITHSMVFAYGSNHLWTRLMHISGEYLGALHPINLSWIPDETKNTQQIIGSMITYAKRYSIGAILNITLDDDDDGNVADRNAAHITNKPPYTPAPTPANNEEVNARKFCDYIEELMNEAKTLPDIEVIYKEYKPKLDKLNTIFPHLYNNIFDVISNRQNALIQSTVPNPMKKG